MVKKSTGILKHNFMQSLQSKSFLFCTSKLHQFQISQMLEVVIWFTAEFMENIRLCEAILRMTYLDIINVYYYIRILVSYLE